MMWFQVLFVSIVFLLSSFSSEAYITLWSNSFAIRKNIQNTPCYQNILPPLMAKSRMPVFDEEDEEELANILTNQRKPTLNPARPKKQSLTPPPPPPPSPPIASSQTIPSSKKTIVTSTTTSRTPPISKSPTSEWAVAKSDFNPYAASQYNAKKPPVVADVDDEFYAFTDLDYADFEAAMREEESGGAVVKSEKRTAAPPVEEYVGLSSGDILAPSIWASLKLANETQLASFGGLMRSPGSSLLLLYEDPRRMTDETRVVLRQLANIPHQTMGLSLVAVNCDDCADLRKFIKKANYPTTGVTMLADTTKKV